MKTINFIFIDSEVNDSAFFFGDNQSQNYQVYLLEKETDALEQIVHVISDKDSINSIHVISHGEDGALKLGSKWLNEGNLQDYSAFWSTLKQVLRKGGEILLYGCEVAKTELGKAFVRRLSALTGANIAASETLTGNAKLGGDWVLGYTTGLMKSGLAFGKERLVGYEGILATYKVTNNNDSGSGSLRDAIQRANSNSGDDVIDLTGLSFNSTIFLNSSLSDITTNIHFIGNSVNINGRDLYQIVTIGNYNQSNNPIVTFDNLDFYNGYARGGDGVNGGGGGLGAGGAVFIHSGIVGFENVLLYSSTARGGNGSIGARGGAEGYNGANGGSGGKLNGDEGTGGNGGNGGAKEVNSTKGSKGGDGGQGGFGVGGGAGGGGGGSASRTGDSAENGDGGRGGRGGFGAGGGAGGGGGGDDDSGSNSGENGQGGSRGSGGNYAGSGSSGLNGSKDGPGGSGGRGGGGAGLGGAVFVRSGSELYLADTSFSSSNNTIGGSGAEGVSILGLTLVESGGNGQALGSRLYNDGTVKISNTSTSGFAGNSPTSFSVPRITLTPSGSISEGGKFTLDVSSNSSLPLIYSVSGNATQGSDFNNFSSRIVDTTFNVTDDRIYDPNERFSITLSDRPFYELDGGVRDITYTYTIVDNEPLISISKVSDLTEGQGQDGEFLITFDKPSPNPGFDLYLKCQKRTPVKFLPKKNTHRN